VCSTTHDAFKEGLDLRIDVSMRMIYVELLYFEPLYGYCLFWLRSCVFCSLHFFLVLSF
jgi:hypothetical protein